MKLTREGKKFFIATILIAIAALNTGNNLTYLVLSMMLSLLLLSVLILMVNVKGLVLGVSQCEPVFAGRPASIEVTLSNRKRIPSYSIKVMMSDRGRAEVYFPKISGSSDISKVVSLLYEKRGIYSYGDFFILSGFPFIFFSHRHTFKVEGEVIVYPEIKEIGESAYEITGEVYESSLLRAGKGDEFAMIREFSYGDDWRRIHWKASARTSKFMVKEYATQEPRRLTIILDNLMPHDTESFEKAVSLTASISDRFLNDDFFVRLLTSRKVIPFGRGREHLFKILNLLATIKGEDRWESPLPAESEGATILILNSEDSSLNRFASLGRVIYAGAL